LILPPGVVERFIGGSHTQRLEDNLDPGLSLQQIRTLRGQLLLGSGGELTPTRTGKRPAHAPYSSAAYAMNLFGRWLGAEKELQIASLRRFDGPLRIEHKLKIAHGGGTANLDCFLEGPRLMVGLEVKLTETLSDHKPTLWRPPYRNEAMHTLLTGGWRDLLVSSLAKECRPRYLDVEQLIKHALALRSHRDSREQHLVYCFWAPAKEREPEEVSLHRKEAMKLANLVGDAPPKLHIIEYSDVLKEWSGLRLPGWIPEHIDYLRRRYSFPL
jgi:hypothetical protein